MRHTGFQGCHRMLIVFYNMYLQENREEFECVSNEASEAPA